MIRSSAALLWIAAAAILTIHAVLTSGMLQNEIWSEDGARSFLTFSAGFAAWSAAWLLIRPAWFAPATIAASVAYAASICGPLAVGAVLLFVAAAFALGLRILPDAGLLALPLGLAIYSFVIAVTVALPIHYPAVYFVLLAPPIVINWKSLVPSFTPQPHSVSERSAFALFAFTAAMHLLPALGPEISADGLAMHLVVPATMANNHQWTFDVRHLIWAVMPMGADWCFSIAYMLGGEQAARLFNYAMLLSIAALVYEAIAGWRSRAQALLLTALFLTTPLVQMVTGSLLVENTLTAFLTGSVAALARARKTGDARYLHVTAILLGAGLATKLGAAAFVIPMAVALAFTRGRTIATAALLVLFAAPPYFAAFAQTGNPVFPFFNATFKSPQFESTRSFRDPRYLTSMRFDTPYDVTFHTRTYSEGHAGGIGFQYFILLPAAILLYRRDWPIVAKLALFVGLAFGFLSFQSVSYIRYVYPALPLFTIAMAALYPRALTIVAVGIAALNLRFLPACVNYNKDFIASEQTIERYAPTRKLVAYLNAMHPGRAVFFLNLGNNQIAGLRGPAYTNTWHDEQFLRRLRNAAGRSPVEIVKLANELDTGFFIAEIREANPAVADEFKTVEGWVNARRGDATFLHFLDEFTVEEYRAGKMQVAALRPEYAGKDGWKHASAEPPPTQFAGRLEALAQGTYDDAVRSISYRGPWWRDLQNTEASGGTLTYCNQPGAAVRFRFNGTGLAYVYTLAFNRGIAEVVIDGQVRATIDLYSRETKWRQTTTFSGLPPGEHSCEIRVLPAKNPESTDYYVDIDSIAVR